MLKHMLSLFHFEMIEDGGGAPLAPEPEPESWAGPSQDEWGSVSAFIQQAQADRDAWEQHYAAQQQAHQAQQQAPGFDLFADDASSQLGSFIQQHIAQAMAPYQSWQQEQQYAEAEERALDIIEDNVSQHGEFLLAQTAYGPVRALANAYLAEEAEKHGWGPKAGEAAIARACAEWREYEKSIGSAYHERQLNQYTRIGEAGREPTGATAGVQQGARVPPGGDELSVVSGFGGFPGRPRF